VGDRGMVKSKGKQALQAEGLRYISALTDPQIRKLLSAGTLQMSLFAEQVCEVEADGVRCVLRKNEDQAAREQHRWDDKLAQLSGKVDQRNEKVKTAKRCQPEAGRRKLQAWATRHKLAGQLDLRVASQGWGDPHKNHSVENHQLSIGGQVFDQHGVSLPQFLEPS